MPAQDMLDVLHYLFESDAIGEEEVQKAKHRLRTNLYTQIYDRAYTWDVGQGGPSDASGHAYGTQEVGSSAATTQLTHKPYIPPTPVNAASPTPYGNVLDAPLG
jgi:hypothetical protein